MHFRFNIILRAIHTLGVNHYLVGGQILREKKMDGHFALKTLEVSWPKKMDNSWLKKKSSYFLHKIKKGASNMTPVSKQKMVQALTKNDGL